MIYNYYVDKSIGVNTMKIRIENHNLGIDSGLICFGNSGNESVILFENGECVTRPEKVCPKLLHKARKSMERYIKRYYRSDLW